MPKEMPKNIRDFEQRAAGTGFTPMPVDPRGPAVAEANKTPNRTPDKTRNIVERKSPVLFKFESLGEFVEGILQNAELVEVMEKESNQKKKVWQYTIFNEAEDQAYKLLGTWDITSKLSRSDVGKFVVIVFTGVNKNIVKNGNPMREFKVGVEQKKSPAEFADGTKITDEDIPF
jgi:hypothetical protein